MSESKFFVKSGNNDFKSRQMDVFGALASFEDKVNLPKPKHHEPMEVDETSRRHKAKKHRRTTRALRGQESLFKTPASPPLKPRIPDYRRNPQRWTKYTLADVSPEDTSERSNTAAAMEFLRSRQQVEETSEELPSRIQFNKTKRNTRTRTSDNDGEDVRASEETAPAAISKRTAFGDASEAVVEPPAADRPVFVNNKLVMPEYVVGEKQQKPKKTRQPRTVVASQLTLTHLMDNDE